MSSRGQGRAVLRPPPTDCIPRKFPDPEGVERFGYLGDNELWVGPNLEDDRGRNSALA
jgi:hypothetical protein